MALVTFNPWGVVPVKIQNQCQGDAVDQGEGGQGHHAADNAPPVKMNFFMSYALGSYCVGSALSAISLD